MFAIHTPVLKSVSTKSTVRPKRMQVKMMNPQYQDMLALSTVVGDGIGIFVLINSTLNWYMYNKAKKEVEEIQKKNQAHKDQQKVNPKKSETDSSYDK